MTVRLLASALPRAALQVKGDMGMKGDEGRNTNIQASPLIPLIPISPYPWNRCPHAAHPGIRDYFSVPLCLCGEPSPLPEEKSTEAERDGPAPAKSGEREYSSVEGVEEHHP